MSSSTLQRLEHVLQITPLATASSSAASAIPLEQFLRTQLAKSLSSSSTTSSTASSSSLLPLLLSLSAATASISTLLRSTSTVSKLGSSNQFGDQQLNVDVATHQCVIEHLKKSGVVATASSEEDPTRIDLSGSLQKNISADEQFSVSFDPLDGSSIIDANFSVGSIFSVFRGKEFLGRRVKDQCAAAISIYGPRTTMMFALPPNLVFEATLDIDGKSWYITHSSMTLSPSTKIFAPANLRCTAEDPAYKKLVEYYMEKKYTLRYSGGLVPDFAHALTKGSGVFLSPTSKSSPPKLRLLYECAALSMLAVCAGGSAVDQNGREMMHVNVEEYEQRSGLIIGSKEEVKRYCEYIQQRKSIAS